MSNPENGTHIKIKIKNGKCRPCAGFTSYIVAFALQLGKKHEKLSVRVVGKFPDIPVAAVHIHP
jgi:hypothetical protein